MHPQPLRMAIVVGLWAAAFWTTGLGRTAAFADDSPAAIKALQGNWKIYREESSLGLEANPGRGMLIEGDGVQIWWGGGEGKGPTGKLRLDPTKYPKEIEIAYTSGHPGKKQLGIYDLSKGQLAICWSEIGDTKRPSKFTAKLTPGAGKNFAVLRREDFQEPDAVAKELKRFEGRWVTPEKNDEGVLIEGDHIVFFHEGTRKRAEAYFSIDPSKKVRQIELVYTLGPENRKKRLGIYKLERSKRLMRLALCLSDPDSEKRPTRFASADEQPGGGTLLSVYLRKAEN